MPHLTASDGVRLWYEEAGVGTPILFVHEFGGDHRSWDHQMRALSRTHRCIAYAARGYPPSDVPEAGEAYSQERACEDVADVLDALGIERAHVVGLSMGAFATVHFGLRHPERALSLLVAGCGYGAARETRTRFAAEVEAMADRIEAQGMAAIVPDYACAPGRVQFAPKDPRGAAEWQRMLTEHSATGSALTLRYVQARRPSLLDLEDDLQALHVPVLLVVGDEDEPALDVTLWLKRTLPAAGLAVLPRTGHAVNLEEPHAFETLLRDFLARVEAGAWGDRDPRSRAASSMSPGDPSASRAR